MIQDELLDSVFTLTLNRPEKSNALTLEMMNIILDHLKRAADDSEVRCIIIKGSGKSFSAGRDLQALLDRNDLEYLMRFDDVYTHIFQMMRRLTKPIVAGVHGYAVGGGFSLAMGCDFLVAHSQAQFGCLEMKQGFPAAINIALLSHHLGRRTALEIAMTGKLISARELHALGIVNRLVEDTEDFSKVVHEYGLTMAKLDPIGVKLTKETFRAVEAVHLEDALIVGKQLNLLLAASGKINEGSRKFSQENE